jgi:hypothetical protein
LHSILFAFKILLAFKFCLHSNSACIQILLACIALLLAPILPSICKVEKLNLTLSVTFYCLLASSHSRGLLKRAFASSQTFKVNPCVWAPLCFFMTIMPLTWR